jgi:hypothetical protein
MGKRQRLFRPKAAIKLFVNSGLHNRVEEPPFLDIIKLISKLFVPNELRLKEDQCVNEFRGSIFAELNQIRNEHS